MTALMGCWAQTTSAAFAARSRFPFYVSSVLQGIQSGLVLCKMQLHECMLALKYEKLLIYEQCPPLYVHLPSI